MIVSEIENVETWCLVAEDLRQHLDNTFSISVTIPEPGAIGSDIKKLDGGDGGVDEGLENDLARTLTAVFIKTECFKIEMG